MRRKQRGTSEELARKLLSGASVVHLATTTPDGTPVLRVLNGVLVDEWMLFHGALVGEKVQCLGRPAVVSAYEDVALIPSHFTSADKACPATTYYSSAQGKGTLLGVEDLGLKARALQQLMDKLQPEGGFVPFAEDPELYRKDLKSTQVFGVALEEVSGKESLGQDKPPDLTRGIVRKLFERGDAGDLPAIERILDRSPLARPAEWTRDSTAGTVVLRLCQDGELCTQHAQLLDRQYWKLNSSPTHIRSAVAQSNAWVGAVTEQGRLVGAARACSDSSWMANIFDVVVHPELRREGIGRWLVERLLEHPLVRNCTTQRLGTQDAMTFYEKLGFRDATTVPQAIHTVAMVRRPEALADGAAPRSG